MQRNPRERGGPLEPLDVANTNRIAVNIGSFALFPGEKGGLLRSLWVVMGSLELTAAVFLVPSAYFVFFLLGGLSLAPDAVPPSGETPL